MTFTKRIDRAVQWAGEKMGAEAKTILSEDFKALESETSLRQGCIEGLQKSTSIYLKWISRRCDALDDRRRSTPISLLGRSMVTHGNEFDDTSELGVSLTAVGRSNERIAELHTNYVEQVTSSWAQHLERSAAMTKDYQAARKKLESRRLAYDASLAKMQKAKRDDFRVEDEMRVCKSKFDDSSEDVLRRMQDIKEVDSETVGALASFLDAELAYHDQVAAELRRARQALAHMSTSIAAPPEGLATQFHSSPSALAWQAARYGAASIQQNDSPTPPRTLACRPSDHRSSTPHRPPLSTTSSFGARVTSLSACARPTLLARNGSDVAVYGGKGEDAFADDDSAASDGISPDWATRSPSSATSLDSLARMNSAQEVRKTPPPPPPPPVDRTKKPPPPPVNRETKPAPPPVPLRRPNRT